MNPQSHYQIDEECYEFDFVGAAIKEMDIRTVSAGSMSKGGSWKFAACERNRCFGYFIVRGRAEFSFDDRVEILETGDLLIGVRDKGHKLGNLTLAQTEGAVCDSTTFLFATIHALVVADCPLGSAMPDYFLFRAGERTESPYLDTQLQCLVWESKAGEPASRLMQARLWEIVFMHSFRVHLAKNKPTRGWLAAICDGQLSRAIAAIHAAPEKDWTVEQLAAESAMSRSTLSRRFITMLNETPMDYLFKQRMRLAANLLREPGATISSVALKVGYSSESAFSTAFHRRFNVWPGAYRDQNH